MAELQVPVTKGKATITVDTDTLTDEVFREAMLQGLKQILNRGMSKVTKETYPGDEEGMKAAAMKIAAKTFEDMKENKIRFTGGKVKKEISGEVMTAAMGLARAIVKQGLKDEGIKLAHVDAKEITKAAKEVLAESPELIQQAKEMVEARKAATEKAVGIRAKAKAIPINLKKKQKDEEEKAERKAASSATKAGKVAPHKPPARPGAQPTAH